MDGLLLILIRLLSLIASDLAWAISANRLGGSDVSCICPMSHAVRHTMKEY